MKAPEIIYTDGKNTCAPAPVFSNIDGNVKYIRADLAELTWEDMKQIDLCFHKVAEEQTTGKLKLHSFREMYEEVLHRFLESKKKIKL